MRRAGRRASCGGSLAGDHRADGQHQRGSQEDRAVEPDHVLLAGVRDRGVRLGRGLPGEGLVAHQPVRDVDGQQLIGGHRQRLVVEEIGVGEHEDPGVLLHRGRGHLPGAAILAGVLLEVAVLVGERRVVRLDRRIDGHAALGGPVGVEPAGAREDDRRAHAEVLQRGHRRMRAVGDGHQVGAVVVLVGSAGERLIVGQHHVVVLEVEGLQHLGHGDVVLGIERDEQPAAAIDEAVERRRLLGQERLLGAHDHDDRDVLGDVLHEAVRRAQVTEVVVLVGQHVAEGLDAGALVGVVDRLLPVSLAVPLREGDRARRLDHQHEALLDLLVQRAQRVLGALDLARQAQLLVARAAHEDDHAVAGDAVLLGLQRDRCRSRSG